jgi:hypothetical protein
MKTENITAWVTKCALTSGIRKVSGTVCHETSSTMLRYSDTANSCKEFVHGNDWHRTPEAALARAEEMRHARIASLKKSLAKVEATMFMFEE